MWFLMVVRSWAVLLASPFSSKVTSSPANAESRIAVSLRSKPMMARYKASVMASRGAREVRACGYDILGGLWRDC